jgi:DNA replication ATP-dependent helicase Dna2
MFCNFSLTRHYFFLCKALLDLLDQVEDAIMEEELPIDPVNKGGQVTNVHNTTSIFPPAVNGDLSIPTTKSIDTPSFDSFLVLEVCLFNFLLLVLS